MKSGVNHAGRAGSGAPLWTPARDDAFLFIGTAAFGATTAGEVRFRTVDLAGRAGDHTLIEIDIDGDAGAEAVIRLNGLHTLTAGDFLL